ncbi:MAG: amidase [bacterium]|nr:amidase [bacterium]
MSDIWRITLAEGLRRIRAGSLTPAEWVRALLGRVDALEGQVRAWAHLDREDAIRQAEECEGKGGAICGAPVGIKDIVDVAGMPRAAGVSFLAGHMPEADASLAARMREAGAVILGKTVTTAFATADPPPTRNPWNLAHTPGGSSSGSAAGVACGMMPAAIGSQTGGSTLRPASFCGVVGLKPTYGRIPRTGVVPVSWSLDHMGILSRTAEDAAILLQVIAGADGRDSGAPDVPVPDYAALSAPCRPARVGFFREETLPRAAPEVADAISRAADRLTGAGAEVAEVRFPMDIDLLHSAHRVIMQAEAAAYHADMFRKHRDEYPPLVREFVSMGAMVPAVHYLRAQRLRARFTRELREQARDFDLLLLPAATERAPAAEASTGNPLLNEPLTFAGFPAVSLPLERGEGNLPIGIQLGAGPFDEVSLLAAARWCEAELGWKSEISEEKL